ncbi:MAG: glycoside hydrolase family 43 protein, partial [Clostridium sp.]|nr:glycoside hydrolase family 43 protein [Clostridium sp.]
MVVGITIGGPFLSATGSGVTILGYEDQIIETAKSMLTIPNSNDIRGNITLPSKLNVNGNIVNISWTSDKPHVINTNEIRNQNYDSTPPGVVTRQTTDTDVTLTAFFSYGMSTGTENIKVKVKAKPSPVKESDYKGYLFTYFSGANRSDAEQIYFSASEDGLFWTELNKNNPVLVSNVGDKGVRDPYIIRSPEGDKFYMVATDLRIANGAGWTAAQRSGSKCVVVWESYDLVNWSRERLVKVARDDAGCTWAPEIVYDDITGEYVLFWASRVAQDNYAKQRIYMAKTRDFYTFTEPVLWIEKSHDVIDTTVIKHNGMYYRFSKNESNKTIFIEKASQLLSNNYQQVFSQSVGSLSGVEGPAVFKFNGENKWCLLLDDYGGSGYFPMVTNDLSSGEFTKLSSSQYSLPSAPRHGTVIQITQSEYDAVMEKWGGRQKPQKDPILEYKFDERLSGRTIADTSGNNNTGTLNGNATYVMDREKNSQVLYLDGSSGTFAAFPQGLFDGMSTVTISMDIKPITVSGDFFTFTIGKDNVKYMFLRT